MHFGPLSRNLEPGYIEEELGQVSHSEGRKELVFLSFIFPVNHDGYYRVKHEIFIITE